MEIRLATQKELVNFFPYLNDHLSDNGIGNTTLFQPMSKSESKLTDSMRLRFSDGINTDLGLPGWRRLWVAIDDNKNVVGHIDIRSHPENHTDHRALLGMGVDRTTRKQGLGKRLIQSMLEWVSNESSIEYIDLWVLSNNIAAKTLYSRTGFEKRGEIVDMFRIDDVSLSYTLMSKAVFS